MWINQDAIESLQRNQFHKLFYSFLPNWIHEDKTFFIASKGLFQLNMMYISNGLMQHRDFKKAPPNEVFKYYTALTLSQALRQWHYSSLVFGLQHWVSSQLNNKGLERTWTRLAEGR